MARRATVAGQFYPSNAKELENKIIESFKAKIGAGMPEHKRNNRIIGCVVPHAGYEYSAQCASHVYKKLAEAQQPDVFVIIGVNHQSSGSGVIISLEDFETPIGIVKNDSFFAKQLISESKTSKKMKKFAVEVILNEGAHAFEHSIEVQLPFLQFITKNSDKELKIVPIILSEYTYDTCISLANLLIDVSKKQKKSICIIASSDFTHYGPTYDFIPFTKNIKKNVYELDKKAVERILKFDSKSFFDYSKNLTICGAGAITVATEFCRIAGAKKSELLSYYTSGDIINDYSNVVGYASIIFE